VQSRRLVTVVALLATLVAPLRAQSPVDTLRMLDSAWARAYATHDTALALALFADDLVMTSSNGARKTKPDELRDVRPYAGLRMHYFRTTGVDIKVHGDAAIVVGVAEWEFTMEGRVSAYRRSYTAVYVRGGPLHWRIVGLHMGNAPASGSGR